MKKEDFLNYLLKKYGEEKPILLKEIKIEGMTNEAIRKQLKELEKIGLISKKARGVYYIPKKNEYNLPSNITIESVYEKKYIFDDTGIFGYYSGLWIENKLGITTQVPNVITIYTNKETNIKRETYIDGWKIILRRPYVKVKTNNVVILQFLEILRAISETDFNDNIDILKKYMEINNILDKDVNKYVDEFPKIVRKRYEYIKELKDVTTRK